MFIELTVPVFKDVPAGQPRKIIATRSITLNRTTIVSIEPIVPSIPAEFKEASRVTYREGREVKSILALENYCEVNELLSAVRSPRKVDVKNADSENRWWNQ